MIDGIEDMTIQELIDNPTQLYDIDDVTKMDIISQLQTITDPELQDQIQNTIANINDPQATIQNLNQIWKLAPKHKNIIEDLLSLYEFKISKEQSDKIISNLTDLASVINPDTSISQLINDDIGVQDQIDSDVESYVQKLNSKCK